MARDASASLAQQMQTWKDVKALYRLLDEADVSVEALMQPHWQQTRTEVEAEAVVLLVQDTKEQRNQRRHREPRETDVWMEMVRQIGSRPFPRYAGTCGRSGCG
jgi:hypothetical protein